MTSTHPVKLEGCDHVWSVTQRRRISEWMASGRLIKCLVATSKTSHFPRQSWQVDIRAKNICLYDSSRQCPGNKAAFSSSGNSIFQLPNYLTPILTIRNSAGARAKLGNVVRRASFPRNDVQRHNWRSHRRERKKNSCYNFQTKLVLVFNRRSQVPAASQRIHWKDFIQYLKRFFQ